MDVEPFDFGGKRGWGLRALRDVKKGEVVYRDSPLASMQNDFSRRCSVNCAQCHRFVGPLSLHVLTLLGKVSSSDQSTARPGATCVHCGALFCSKACEANAKWHTVLCVDLSDDQRKAVHKFNAFANEKHEGLILAARLLALGPSPVDFYSLPFHTLNPRDRTLKDPEARLAMLDSAADLMRPFLPTVTPEVLDTLLGTFDLVNTDIEFANPHLTEFNETYANTDMISRCRSVAWGDEKKDDVSEDPLPPFIGFGIYPLLGRTNHSCDPNAELDFENSNLAIVTAVRDIAKGEEIVQSYIDESLPANVRRDILEKEYQFTCCCDLCRTERVEDEGHREAGRNDKCDSA